MKMYCYKKCSTCKKAAAFLRERGSSFEEIDYTEQPLSTEQLRAYWQTSGLPLKKFFNTSGMIYRESGLKDRIKEMSDEEMLEAMEQAVKMHSSCLSKRNAWLYAVWKIW